MIGRVVVKPETGKSFVAGALYYAAVMPGTYTGGLTIRYMYNDTVAHTLTEIVKSNTTELKMAAGHTKVLGVIHNGNTYNAVQLWEDGPYWATTNIGASSTTDAGYYFAWGYTEGCIRKDNSWVLASDQSTTKTFSTSSFPDRSTSEYKDAATAYWGKGWTVPSETDFSNLQANCNDVMTADNGRNITGKANGYTSNTIFFPAVGWGIGADLNGLGTSGYYWTSTEASPNAKYYGISSDGTVVYEYHKYEGHAVRPIHAQP